MRSLTVAQAAALVAGTLQPVYLVKQEFVSGTKYSWTGVNTVLWDSQDWEGQGDLMGVSSITQTADLSAEGVTITYAGVNADDVSSTISDIAANLAVDIYLGLLDSTSAIIVDPTHCFSGKLDVPTVQDDGDTATIAITAENDLLKLSQASNRRYTNDDQQIDYPTDNGFQFVPVVQAWNGAWGGAGGRTISGGLF